MRRRWIVAAFLIAGILIGLVLASRPRKYVTSGILRIEPGRASSYEISPSQALSGGSSLDDKLNTEVLILGSRGLLLRLARDLDLANKPDFYPPAKRGHQSLDDPKTQEEVLDLLRASIVIAHLPKTEVVQISSTTKSPALSATIANTLINDYIENVLEVRYGSTARVSKWLIGQHSDLKAQVERDQQELVELESRLGVISLDSKNSTSLNADTLQSLDKATTEATIARILAEARFRYLNESDPNLIENEQPVLNTPTVNSLLQTLRTEQAKALSDYAALASQFGANYPPLKDAKARLEAINRQVKTEQDRILNQAKVAYSAANENEAMTRSALNAQQKVAFSSRSDIVRFQILQREYESHRTLYEGLVERLREAGISAGLQSASIDVVDLAALPYRPKPPGPGLWILLSVLGLLLLGAIVAVIIDLIDARFDSVEDAERVLNIPGLAMLPLESVGDQREAFVTATSPTSHYAEGTQLLRNAVMMSDVDKKLKTIIVASAWPGEGKSTTARELASTLALHNATVLLIDGDLRKPSQHARMRLKRTPGLTSVITGAVSLDDAMQKIPEVEGLWVLTAGPTPPQSAVLWTSDQMKRLLATCRNRFDYIIIDSAPVLSVADVVLAAAMADACLLVIRQHLADQRSIREAVKLLQRTGKLIGFVLNAVDTRWNSYMPYYNRYSYGSYGAEEKKQGKSE